MKKYLKTIILLWFLVSTAAATSDVTIRALCPPGNNLQQPMLVIRDNPISVRYSLVNNRPWVWMGYPELNDKFYLEYSQRVRIWYRISIWMSNAGAFWTRLKIDGYRPQQYIAIGTGPNERVMYAFDEVWLQKGQHYVNVQYLTTGNVSDMPPNSQGTDYYGILRIQYLQFQ